MRLMHSIAVVAVVLLTLLPLSHAFTFTVQANEKQCFIENIEKGTEVQMSFQVTEGGFLDIDATVTSPEGQLLYAGRKEKDGKYFFVTHVKGNYQICFSNEMSTVTHKIVSFNLVVGQQRTEDEIVKSILTGSESKRKDRKSDDDVPHIRELQASVLQLADGIHSIQSEEKYLRLRERVHRDTSESTNTRVLGWSLVETVTLISISLWQIYYLRRFFEVRRPV